jgi:magnesium chelatase family protein
LITVNLAPADVRKEGPSFDLPVALGPMAATSQVCSERLADLIIVGELSLDGSVRPVSGVLPIAIGAQQSGKRGIIVPSGNAREAAVVAGVDVYPVSTLLEAVALLNDGGEPYRRPEGEEATADPEEEIDFGDVRG